MISWSSDFTADGLDEKWLTDITEHWTGEGKLYLCAIKDVCSNRIAGYAIDKRMKASLVVRALENALQQRGYPEGVILGEIQRDVGRDPRLNKFSLETVLNRYNGSKNYSKNVLEIVNHIPRDDEFWSRGQHQ